MVNFGLCQIRIRSLRHQSRSRLCSWQIIELYRKRADCENVFDELKNQWEQRSRLQPISRGHRFATRLLLLAYNTWNLFLRLLEPNRHVEAKHGRRWFLFAQRVWSNPKRPANLENGHFWTLAGRPLWHLTACSKSLILKQSQILACRSSLI